MDGRSVVRFREHALADRRLLGIAAPSGRGAGEIPDGVDFALLAELGTGLPREFSVSNAARTLFCDTVSHAGASNDPARACSTVLASWSACAAFRSAGSSGLASVRTPKKTYRVTDTVFRVGVSARRVKDVDRIVVLRDETCIDMNRFPDPVA